MEALMDHHQFTRMDISLPHDTGHDAQVDVTNPYQLPYGLWDPASLQGFQDDQTIFDPQGTLDLTDANVDPQSTSSNAFSLPSGEGRLPALAPQEALAPRGAMRSSPQNLAKRAPEGNQQTKGLQQPQQRLRRLSRMAARIEEGPESTTSSSSGSQLNKSSAAKPLRRSKRKKNEMLPALPTQESTHSSGIADDADDDCSNKGDGTPVTSPDVGEPSSDKSLLRARNRQAAAKFRVRKKLDVEKLKKAEAEATASNQRLNQEASRLRDESLTLKNMVLEHAACGCPQIDDYIQHAARDWKVGRTQDSSSSKSSR